jgi:hypothetical protein
MTGYTGKPVDFCLATNLGHLRAPGCADKNLVHSNCDTKPTEHLITQQFAEWSQKNVWSDPIGESDRGGEAK